MIFRASCFAAMLTPCLSPSDGSCLRRERVWANCFLRQLLGICRLAVRTWSTKVYTSTFIGCCTREVVARIPKPPEATKKTGPSLGRFPKISGIAVNQPQQSHQWPTNDDGKSTKRDAKPRRIEWRCFLISRRRNPGMATGILLLWF